MFVSYVHCDMLASCLLGILSILAVRCGYLVAHPNTIEALKPRYNPKSCNSFAQLGAYHALQEVESYYQPYIKATNLSREAFLEALTSRGVRAQSGGAGNFICVYVPSGKTLALCERLEQKAIFVRDIGARFPHYVRITIGLDMSRVVEEVVVALSELGEITSS